MVGLGEEMHELLEVYRDLAGVGFNVLTIGQYLRPSRDHLPMARYYTPRNSRVHEARNVEDGFPPRRVRPAGPQRPTTPTNKRIRPRLASAGAITHRGLDPSIPRTIQSLNLFL